MYFNLLLNKIHVNQYEHNEVRDRFHYKIVYMYIFDNISIPTFVIFFHLSLLL